MEEVLKNESQEVKRPWQGTTWAFINVVSLIIVPIILMFILFAGLLANSFADNGRGFNNYENSIEYESFEEAMGEFIILAIFIFGLIIVTFLILKVVLIIGFFKGWKWTVITAIVFNSLGTVSGLGFFMKSGGEGFITLCISGFLLYLAIFCLKHPFYNQKKVN